MQRRWDSVFNRYILAILNGINEFIHKKEIEEQRKGKVCFILAIIGAVAAIAAIAYGVYRFMSPDYLEDFEDDFDDDFEDDFLDDEEE